jgi:hypothetical protein
MPPNLSTSATTDLLRVEKVEPRGREVVYEASADDRSVSYTIEPHPPTPREKPKP